MMNNMFVDTILKQIEDYLHGDINKEEYYRMAERFYSEHAQECPIPQFNEIFLLYIPMHACSILMNMIFLMRKKKKDFMKPWRPHMNC